MAIDVQIKKWGNSLGVVLPKEFLVEQKLKENDKVSIELVKPVDLRSIFGSLKRKDMNGQEMKDFVRKGWD